MMKTASLILALLSITGPVSAGTVTFSGGNHYINTQGEWVRESEGFEFMTSSAYGVDGTITMHDDGGITRSTIKRVDGGSFTPLSIMVQGWNRMARTGSGPAPDYFWEEDEFNAWYRAGSANVPILEFTGLFASGLSVTQTVEPFPGYVPVKFDFGSEFAGIEKLSLSLLYPDTSAGTGIRGYYRTDDPYGLSTPDTDWCPEWCAEVHADDLIVAEAAAVPVPAAGMMLAAALLGLGALRLRRH